MAVSWSRSATRGLIKGKRNNKMTEEHSLTVVDVAQRLNVDESTVRRWLQSGALKGIRLAAGWLVSEAELQVLIDVRRRVADEDRRDYLQDQRRRGGAAMREPTSTASDGLRSLDTTS